MFYNLFTTILTIIYYFNNFQNLRLFKIVENDRFNNIFFISSLFKIIHNLKKNESSREIIFIIKKITLYAHK